MDQRTKPSGPAISAERDADAYRANLEKIGEREEFDDEQQARLQVYCRAYLAGVADGSEFALQIFRRAMAKSRGDDSAN